MASNKNSDAALAPRPPPPPPTVSNQKKEPQKPVPPRLFASSDLPPASPMGLVPPPLKKQRASDGSQGALPNHKSASPHFSVVDADEKIAKRRAMIRSLQKEAGSSTTSGSKESATASVLERARLVTSGPAPRSSISSNGFTSTVASGRVHPTANPPNGPTNSNNGAAGPPQTTSSGPPVSSYFQFRAKSTGNDGASPVTSPPVSDTGSPSLYVASFLSAKKIIAHDAHTHDSSESAQKQRDNKFVENGDTPVNNNRVARRLGDAFESKKSLVTDFSTTVASATGMRSDHGTANTRSSADNTAKQSASPGRVVRTSISKTSSKLPDFRDKPPSETAHKRTTFASPSNAKNTSRQYPKTPLPSEMEKTKSTSVADTIDAVSQPSKGTVSKSNSITPNLAKSEGEFKTLPNTNAAPSPNQLLETPVSNKTVFDSATAMSPPDTVLKKAEKALETDTTKTPKHVTDVIGGSSGTTDSSPITTLSASSPPDTVMRQAANVLHQSKDQSLPSLVNNSHHSESGSKRDLLNAMYAAAETPNKKVYEKMEKFTDVKIVANASATDNSSALPSSILFLPNHVAAKVTKSESLLQRTNNGSMLRAATDNGADTLEMANHEIDAAKDYGTSKSNVLRLMKELTLAKDEKAAALRSAAQLEKEVMTLRLEHKSFELSPKGKNDKTISKASNFFSDLAIEGSDDLFLKRLVKMAVRDGETAAIAFAKAQMEQQGYTSFDGRRSSRQFGNVARDIASSPPSSLSESPELIVNGRNSSSTRSSRSERMGQGRSDWPVDGRRRRVKSPTPRRRISEADFDEGRNFKVEVDMKYLTSAAKAIWVEYTSELATYVVRSPFETNSADRYREMWVNSTEDYLQSANVHEVASLEVLAMVFSDKSVLVLHDSAKVSRGTLDDQNEYKWNDLGDVDEMGVPLGSVTYVDFDGSEKEYWLDAIYEEALTTRETYCSSLISAASALQSSASIRISEKETDSSPVWAPERVETISDSSILIPPLQQSPIEANSPLLVMKPAKMDVCVGTEDIPFPVSESKTMGRFKKDQQTQTKEQYTTGSCTATEETKTTGEKVGPPPAEDLGATDVLSAVIIFLWSNFLRVIWFFLVRLPLKIVSAIAVYLLFRAVVYITWLSLANDNGASLLGAGVDYKFNPPGIY